MGLVSVYDGAACVESSPQQGTVFRIFLPLPDTPSLTGRMDNPPASEPTESKGVVLLVDDDPIVRAMVESMLKRRLGHDVIGCGDPVEAMEIFRAHTGEIDFALIDFNLQGANGRKLAANLRELRPELPVILCSGDDDVRSEWERRAEARLFFLQKPYGVEDLKTAVAEVLKSRDAGEA